ncbi:AMP-binding protein, partial [Streptomyces sp. NPDC086077]|uniref:AMP-binding protein n=1 Tax=Streptomyces sp. NPDC086077 TaxID=3154862 RepID=UPI00342ABB85
MDPALPVTCVDVLEPAERVRVLEEWNDTAAEVADVTVPDLFEAQVERTPDAIAVVCGGEELSYREINARANRLARVLVAHGVGPEIPVALLLEPSIDLVVGIIAVWKAGGVCAPLDPRSTQNRAIHFTAKNMPLVGITASRQTAVATPVGAGDWLVLSDGDITTNTGDAIRVRGDKSLPRGTRTHPLNSACILPRLDSSGQHTDVVVEHQALASYYAAWESMLPDSRDAVLLTSLPAHTAMATIAISLARGECLHITDASSKPTSRQYGAAILQAPARRVIQEVLPTGETYTGHLIFEGHHAALGETLKQWRALHGNSAVIAQYVTTGLIGPGAYYRIEPDAPEPGRAIPLGKPADGTRLYVLDTQLQPVPVGVAGELYVAGGQLARGYAGCPGLSAERFVADPHGVAGTRMYRTGDLARWNARGELKFLGHANHQVTVRGFRVELGEIEAALAHHPGVAQAVVVAERDELNGQHLVAYVVRDRQVRGRVSAQPGRPVHAAFTEADLRQTAMRLLPDYLVPSFFVVLDSLPLTEDSKVDHDALPSPNQDLLLHGDLPNTVEEELLAGLFAEVLDLPRAGSHDSFFELGGHSLLATRLLSRIRDVFDVELPIRTLFEYSTVSELA